MNFHRPGRYLILFVISFLSSTTTFSQNIVEWQENYTLKFSDFQSKATQIGDVNVYSVQADEEIEFLFQMSTPSLLLRRISIPK